MRVARRGQAGWDSCPLWDRWGNPGLSKCRAKVRRGWDWTSGLGRPVLCSFCSAGQCFLALGVFYAVGFS